MYIYWFHGPGGFVESQKTNQLEVISFQLGNVHWGLSDYHHPWTLNGIRYQTILVDHDHVHQIIMTILVVKHRFFLNQLAFHGMTCLDTTIRWDLLKFQTLRARRPLLFFSRCRDITSNMSPPGTSTAGKNWGSWGESVKYQSYIL